MKIIREHSELPAGQPLAISIGNFDGIHSGHRHLVSHLVKSAQGNQIPAAVVTFEPHPIEVLVPGQRIPRLTTIERRGELLEACGVDYLVVLDTNEQLLSLTYQEFFQQFIVDRFQAKAIIEGPNFYFGRNREGTPIRLAEICAKQKIDLSIVELSKSNDGVVSSSMIRELLRQGDVREVNQLLVDPYQLTGRVSTGATRGRELGFPTANLVEIPTLIPGPGVYAGWATVDGKPHRSAIHVGSNPTFGEDELKVEVHLIGEKLNLYDRSLNVDLKARIRGVRKFESPDELVQQIDQDIASIIELLPA